jgi:signal transduction histidine kinase
MLLATLNLVLLFSIAPIQVRIRRAVEIVFSRRGYDADRVLSELSSSLASAHTLGEVRARLDRVLTESLFPVSTAMFEWSGGPALCPVPPGNEATEPLVLPPPLAARAERAEILAVYEWDDGSQRPVPPIWRALEADLMVPVCSGQRPMAMVTLGPKASGRTYNDRDVAFLRGVASQVAMALASAEAFGELERLNASLEQQVQERTAALQEANGDLKRSYEDVRVAYQQLEKSQESLMRSDRLATLGRLTASIAHEVNTPLGAALNSLTMLRDLGAEYAESIEDPAVTTQDHRQIATDLLREVEQATRFARNAAAFVNRVRIHGRDTDGQGDQRFLVKSVVAETQALLAHRMRAVCCSLSFEQAEDVTLVGDPTRLGQVLTNLVANAVDAYEDARILDGSVDVAARRIEDRIVLTVRDRAGGIPAEILPRIFDELFTTKPPGRGTGLGLCIARSVVERSFGGTMAVESEQGVGTCFTLTLPVAREGRDAAPPAPAVA